MKLYALVLVMWLSGVGLARAAVQPDEATLQQMLEEARASAGLVGAGALVQVGDTVTAVAVGERKHGSGVMVTANDQWHLGSIGKSMTATVIARLVEQGALDWDAPLSALLPDLAAKMHPDWANVTLVQLLSHTAGAPASIGLLARLNEATDPDELRQLRRTEMTAVLRKAPVFAPQTGWQYSNVGYTIAGAIAEAAMDKPWEVLVREQLFAPLGLASAGFGAPGSGEALDQPWGHARRLGMRSAQNPDGFADNTQIMSPAGTIHMTMQDLARFATLHRTQGATQPDYLSSASWQKLHTPVREDYALGLIVYDRPWADGQLIWHNGSNTMWYALMLILPAKDSVMVFVTNDGDVKKAEAAFIDMARDVALTLPTVSGSE